MILLKKNMNDEPEQVRIADQKGLKEGLDGLEQSSRAKYAGLYQERGVLGRSDDLRQTVGDRTPLRRDNPEGSESESAQ